MKNKLYSVETKIKIEFYDVDSMKIVYHGNYVKFLEVGRCALLDKIGYNYNEMEKDGYSFPITKLNVKYIRSLVFGEAAIVKTSVVEYENMLKLQYEIFKEDGTLATTAETCQMAIRMKDMETMFVCPERMIKKFRSAIGGN